MQTSFQFVVLFAAMIALVNADAHEADGGAMNLEAAEAAFAAAGCTAGDRHARDSHRGLPLIYGDDAGDLRTETMAECGLISDAMNAALGVSASEVTCLAGFNGGKYIYSCTDESVKRLNELGVDGIADGVYSAWSPLSCRGNYYNGDLTAAKALRAFLEQNECAQHNENEDNCKKKACVYDDQDKTCSTAPRTAVECECQATWLYQGTSHSGCQETPDVDVPWCYTAAKCDDGLPSSKQVGGSTGPTVPTPDGKTYYHNGCELAKKSCSSFNWKTCEKKGCDWSKTGDAQFKTCKEFAEDVAAPGLTTTTTAPTTTTPAPIIAEEEAGEGVDVCESLAAAVEAAKAAEESGATVATASAVVVAVVAAAMLF